MARQEIENPKREAPDTFHHPDVGDRIEKWTYTQLPWNPPMIWTGTQYDGADRTCGDSWTGAKSFGVSGKFGASGCETNR